MKPKADPHTRTAEQVFETPSQEHQEMPPGVFKRRRQTAMRMLYEATYGPQEARDER